MNTRNVLLIAGVVVGLCICCFVVVIGLGIVGGFGLTQPAADAGEKFMQSLKAGDYNTAYALCHPSLQQKLGSAQGLKQLVENGKAQPSTWNFTSRNIENAQAHLEGTATMQGGNGTVTLDLVQVGSDWKVIGFNLTPR
jgi:hypothetical protein